MQHSLKGCVIYLENCVLKALQFFDVLGICTCIVCLVALSCWYFLFVFKEWQNLETWLFSCLHVCSSIPNIFSGDNASLIQLVPRFYLLIAGGVNLTERLHGEWSQATSNFFLTESLIINSVIPPSNWYIVCGVCACVIPSSLRDCICSLCMLTILT